MPAKHLARPKRKQPTRLTAPAQPVTVSQVNPTVWRHAMQLAGGDAKRIEIITATKVIVS